MFEIDILLILIYNTLVLSVYSNLFVLFFFITKVILIYHAYEPLFVNILLQNHVL